MTAPALLASVRVVVFDVDDTLYLEREYVQSGFLAVETTTGIDGFATEAWSLFVGGARHRTFDLTLERLGIPTHSEPGLVPRLVEIYRQHTPNISLAIDAAKAIDVCERAGLTLAIVSDGPVASQSAKIRALGLSDRCHPVILTNAFRGDFGKPHPGAFQAVAQASGRAAVEHVYVADNPAKDFQAPGLMGWLTVRVRRVGSLYGAIATPDDVDAEMCDLAGLPALLGLADSDGF